MDTTTKALIATIGDAGYHVLMADESCGGAPTHSTGGQAANGTQLASVAPGAPGPS